MSPEQRRILAELLIQWEDLYRQGQDTPADVLCKDDPELAATLARQIAALKRVAWLDKKLEDDGDDPDDPSRDDPSPPRLLAGRYRLDELIATGGFAEVWRAYDQELQRIIAVKIPKRTVIDAADSFLAEARRVARLKHPAILPVYDVGLDGSECFFVSEYVEGGSLADWLLKGKRASEQACRWISAIADALDHAHSSGVIHRDIKPGNILIDAHDRALLADFGIAQSSIKTGAFAPSLGTLRYMAPEQLAGQEALPQSDIYSLGVVLHEVLTGKPPYSSSDPNSLRRDIASGAQISRDIPRHLVPVLRRALDKRPEQRFGSAADFAAAVRAPKRNRQWLVPLAAVIAASTLAAFLLVRQPPVVPVAKPEKPATTRDPGLPPLDRMIWLAAKPQTGKTFQFDTARGWWVEHTTDGKPLAFFMPEAITEDYIHVIDRARNLAVRLYDDRCEYSLTNDFVNDYSVLSHGHWASTAYGPLPAALYEVITLVLGRRTFSTYIDALSDATGVAMIIDSPALAAIGLSPDEHLDLKTKREPASQFLDRLLTTLDPENRLTLRAIQKADGSACVTITTKNAIGHKPPTPP